MVSSHGALVLAGRGPGRRRQAGVVGLSLLIQSNICECTIDIENAAIIDSKSKTGGLML